MGKVIDVRTATRPVTADEAKRTKKRSSLNARTGTLTVVKPRVEEPKQIQVADSTWD